MKASAKRLGKNVARRYLENANKIALSGAEMLTDLQYGRVERLYIDQENRQVFIKFTDQVSALRVCFSTFQFSIALLLNIMVTSYTGQAVNELDGRVFNGNTIIPKFYDLEKFERGAYK